jgi:hypothetical protein
MSEKNITKCTDDDGHWYWIPNELLCEFKSDLNKIIGKAYMDCPDEFDSFIDKYDKYMTLGSPDNIPEFFK